MDDPLSISHSMPQLHPVLPIELFEEIIGHTSDNTASLQHLSLTCHAFLPRARYHLFTSIRIHTVQQLDSSGEFLDSHPWLTPLIRCVAFCVLTAAPGSLSAPADRASRLLDVVPVHLLSRLPNIYIWRVGAEGYSPRDQAPSQLSLHRFAPSCYRKYGISITNLELSNVRFDGISDFARLVSAFASIQSLSASFIFFRKAGEDDESSLLSDFTEETTMPRAGRSLFIKRLQIGVHKDIRVVGYLLLASATTANTLNLTIRDGGPWHEHDNYINRLEELTSRFSQLASLTVVIKCDRRFVWGDWIRRDERVSRDIRFATRILEHVQRAHLREIRVEFQPDSLASLAGCFSGDAAPLEACKALEEVLLTFKAPYSVLFQHPIFYHRPGRIRLWSLIMKHAFQRLDDRGLLKLPTEPEPYLADTPGSLGHEGPLTCMIASHDSKWIATASFEGTIIIWDVERCTILEQWLAHRGLVHDLAFSPDNRRLLSAGGGSIEALVVVWDISDGIHKITALEEDTTAASVTSCAWSPDGYLIASASRNGIVCVRDAQTFQQHALFKESEDAGYVSLPRNLQFSPDGTYLAWRRERPGRCTIWVPLVEKQPKIHLDPPQPSTPSGRTGPLNAFSFDPRSESKRIATAHGGFPNDPEDSVVRIWDIATGTILAVLAGHSQHIWRVSFSRDGRLLMSASDDSSTKIWNAKSWEETASLEVEGDKSQIFAANFSPDGNYLATGSSNGTVRLWRTGDASCVAMFTEHEGERVQGVVFSPDGEFLASGDLRGIVHIRRISSLVS